MREIKFRAWNTRLPSGRGGPLVLSTMVYFGLCELDEGYIDPPGSYLEGDYKLMQYTGLKDKNGKEIYIDDFCRLNNKTYDPGDSLLYEGVVLVVGSDDLGYKLRPIAPMVGPDTMGFDSTSMWHFAKENTTEVIGNIYENPELLEANK